MKQEQLEKLKDWFDGYVAGFYGDDGYVNANLKLKEDHSRRTRREMLYLAEQLGFDAGQKQIAEAIGLLHDVGRFEQFAKYRTYNDPRSVNHCLLGLEILQNDRVLDGIQPDERELIEKAIEYHGLKELPGNLNGRSLLYCKLIRDADKLDVYYVVTNFYRAYRTNAEQFVLEVELPDEPGYSPEIVEDILHGRRTDYVRLRTLNDMKLLQLGWVFDVNFTATLKRIRKAGFLEAICETLGADDDIEKVKDKVLGFVHSQITEAEGDKSNAKGR